MRYTCSTASCSHHAGPGATIHEVGESRQWPDRRCRPGSVRHWGGTAAIAALNARIANPRADTMHNLTTWLAKTHGTVVVESLNVASMLLKKHIPGARRRRLVLADALLSELRRHLFYKCGWYSSALGEADVLFPSSGLCHVCLERNEPGWNERWTCVGCGSQNDRDDIAAINLARHFRRGGRRGHSWCPR